MQLAMILVCLYSLSLSLSNPEQRTKIDHSDTDNSTYSYIFLHFYFVFRGAFPCAFGFTFCLDVELFRRDISYSLTTSHDVVNFSKMYPPKKISILHVLLFHLS